MAKHAIESECDWTWHGGAIEKSRGVALDRVMDYATGAIILAVAGVEAMINEMLSGTDSLVRKFNPQVVSPFDRPPGNLTIEAVHRWKKLWARDAIRRCSPLEKIQIALEAADLKVLSEGEGSIQDFRILTRLRNQLVHNVPIPRRHGGPIEQRDKLERVLRGKFKPSTVVPESYSFFWYRCLSGDCARWAVYTDSGVTNEFYCRLGIPITSDPNLPDVAG